MKHLLVLRHAKASPDSSSGRDFDRPLTGLGHRAAAAIGRTLKAGDHRLDAVLSSPAARAVETVAHVTPGAASPLAPRLDRRLYNAPPETLLEVIGEVDGAIETLLIVGHNPGLQQLILELADDDSSGLRAQVGSNFPTATLAELRLSIDHWDEAGPGCGRLLTLLRPGDLGVGGAGPE